MSRMIIAAGPEPWDLSRLELYPSAVNHQAVTIEAYIVAGEEPPGGDQLDQYLRDVKKLSGFKVPKAFHQVDNLPVGPTDKLYRRALRRND